MEEAEHQVWCARPTTHQSTGRAQSARCRARCRCSAGPVAVRWPMDQRQESTLVEVHPRLASVPDAYELIRVGRPMSGQVVCLETGTKSHSLAGTGPPKRRTQPRTDPARHHSRRVTATGHSGLSVGRRAQTGWQRPRHRKQRLSAGSPRRRRASRPRRCPGDRTDEAPGSPHVGPATP